MKDTEMRGLLLSRYHEHRREAWWYPNESDVNGALNLDDIFYISEQLAEAGLIDWRPIRSLGTQHYEGMGHISALGIDVIEGEARAPFSIVIKNYSVNGDNFGIVGDSNSQSIEPQIELIVSSIDKSSHDEKEKKEAKGLLKKFLEHPLVTAIAGAAVAKYLS